jgi:hypothetical protein
MERPTHRAPFKTAIPLACKWLLMRSIDKEWEQCVRAFDGESASVIDTNLVVGADLLFNQ